DEVPQPLRLAVVLRSRRHDGGDRARGPFAGTGPYRGAVCLLPRAPGTRLRRRRVRHTHRPAVLHQLGRDGTGAQRRVATSACSSLTLTPRQLLPWFSPTRQRWHAVFHGGEAW